MIAIGVMVGQLVVKSDKYDALVDDIAFSRCLSVDLSNYDTHFYFEEWQGWKFEAENDYRKITVVRDTADNVKAVVTNTYCK